MIFVAEDVWCGEDCCRRQSNCVVSCSNLSCRACFVNEVEVDAGVPVSAATSEAALTLTLPGRLIRLEPATTFAVVLVLNFRLGLSRRCNLYSTGPSWGSACKRTVETWILDASEREGLWVLPLAVPFCCVRAGLGGVPAVTSCHGEATRGVSGSKVKIEAILPYDLA
jgi:hypothetical protein